MRRINLSLRRKRRGTLSLLRRSQRRRSRPRRKLLGEGWQGRVYARNGLVVRKEFKRIPFKNIRRSVTKEASIQKRLSRKKIAPRVIGTGRNYIDMQRVRGRTLTSHTANNPRRQRKYGRKLARTVNRMHDLGVSHQDLHGKNVLITPTGKLKVIDYGQARDRGRPLTSRERRKDYRRVLQSHKGASYAPLRQSFEQSYRP